MRLMKACEYCFGEFFPNSIEQVYCSKIHAKKAAKQRAEERKQIREMTINGTGHGLCPHPYKRGYSSPEQAALDPFPAERYELYRCQCGCLHYTSNLTRNPNREAYRTSRPAEMSR
jgi:hypothetical protein